MKKISAAVIIFWALLGVCASLTAQEAYTAVVDDYEVTSELEDPQYPGLYTGWHVFDGDPVTSWVEGQEGAGLGEGIALGFGVPLERKLQRIEIMPGFFHPSYWKANNRIKNLDVKARSITGEEITVQAEFEDVMKAQPIDIGLYGVISLEFTVKEVYPGDKWNDTCIAELKLFDDGNREIIIDPKGLPGRIQLPQFSSAAFDYGDSYTATSFRLKADGTLSGKYEEEIEGHSTSLQIEGTWKFNPQKESLEFTYREGKYNDKEEGYIWGPEVKKTFEMVGRRHVYIENVGAQGFLIQPIRFD